MNTFFKAIVNILLVITSVVAIQAQWEQVQLPSPFGNSYYLDVFFLPSNPNYGWITGFDGKVLRTTDAGKSWNGAIIFGNPFLESVHFPSQMVGYVSGPGGVYKSIDGGITWKDITPPYTVSQIWGCYFVDEENGFVVGGGCSMDNQTFMKTTNGGLTWQINYGFESQSGMSDIILYEKNGLGYAVSSGVLWKTINGGDIWTVLSYSGPKYWTEELTNKGNSFLLPTAGEDCSGGNKTTGSLRFSTDRGGSWNTTIVNKAMFGAYLLDQNRGWACGDKGEVLYTSNNGKNWEKKNCGIGSSNIDDIWFINDTTGWAVGEGVYQYIIPTQSSFMIQKPNPPYCFGSSITLSAPKGTYSQFSWHKGNKNNQISNEDKIIVQSSDWYYLQSYNYASCTWHQDSLFLEYLPSQNIYLELSGDSILCKEEVLQASVNGPVQSCMWSTTEKQSSIFITQSGDYSVKVIDTNGCVYIFNTPTIIRSENVDPKIFVNGKTSLCKNEKTQLLAPLGFSVYKWNDGDSSLQKFVDKQGDYWLRVIDKNGCEFYTDTVSIAVLSIENNIESFFSSSFSFDSLVLGKDSCISLTIRNKNTNQDIFIPSPHLVHNIVFSIPPAQFPIQIKPGEAYSFTICFTPYKIGLWTDTLIISDTCSPLILPLIGYVNQRNDSVISNCTVPITIGSIQMPPEYGKVFTIAPHPITESLHLYIQQSMDIHSLSLVSPIGEIYSLDLMKSNLHIYSQLPSFVQNGYYMLKVNNEMYYPSFLIIQR